jgi:uncharacterized protein YcaQ
LFAGDAVPAVERREHLERPSLALRRTTVGDAISAAAARRIAIAAQGLGEGRPAPENIGPRHLRAVVGRLGLLQIDSVSVLARAHYLPLFSRLGPYARELLDTAAWGKRPRRMFEYWAHEASLLPVEMQPLFRWRMDRAAALQGLYGELAAFAVARRDFVETVLAEVGARGPLVSGDLEGPRGVGGWWGWSDAKRALELLFWMGRLTTATRRGFERVYDLPERVLPAAVLAVPTPSPREAHRALLALAARALGVASEADLRDYFRLDIADTRPLLAELVEAGELLAVRVAGWAQPAYLHRDARRPRSVATRALLAPFDPLIWERARTERLFGFRYRLEIYTPAEKRVHGYYVLPFLLGEALVARVDLKTSRATGELLVLAAHAEAHAPAETASALAAELRLMADWLGLERVTVRPAGDLAARLAAEVT